MNKSLVLQPQPRGRRERELPDACGTDPALFWPAGGCSIHAGTAGSGWSVAHLPSLCKMDTTQIHPHRAPRNSSSQRSSENSCRHPNFHEETEAQDRIAPCSLVPEHLMEKWHQNPQVVGS